MQNSIKSHASLLRRLAALVYDGLLLFAVTMVAGFLITPFLGEINIENHGTNETIFNPLMLAYYLIVYYLFFTWFWTHGGQTLGMRAWHTRLLTSDGKLVNWKQALFRFMVSLPMWFFWIIAIGNSTGGFVIPYFNQAPNWLIYTFATAWLCIDHLPNNWRDRLTGTYIIHIPNN
jgi:uncharacterized RDD family membrane protein YckC